MKHYRITLLCNDIETYRSDPEWFSVCFDLYRTIVQAYESVGYRVMNSNQRGDEVSVTLELGDQRRVVSLEENT
ncbi:MAG TPA: hypothetical protein DCQ90_04015 [Erysipelotrichaceae bacterium]|nr:hypothetical protein [Erysipelotrichaceae bacterium]